MATMVKEVVIGSARKRKIKIVSQSEEPSKLVEDKIISQSDVIMDIRAKEATKAAISRAKICNKPIAKYDKEMKKVYIEQPDGGKQYIE